MRFADPVFLLLLVVPAAWAWSRWRAGASRRPSGSAFRASPSSPALRSPGGARWPWLPEALRMLGLALLLVALARPQVPHEVRQIRSKSREHHARAGHLEQHEGGRLQAGQPAHGRAAGAGRLQPRAEGRPAGAGDLRRPRLPAGAAHARHRPAATGCSGRVDIGMLPDGTAIGTALAMCLAQLKDLPPKASVIVLITDGANNTGKPSPLVAAEAARAIGVRIHTIGVSAADTTGPDKQFIWRWGGRTPDRLTSGDEAILKRISDRSGGRYFRATDPETLARILEAIDPIERQEVKISETRDYRELYAWRWRRACCCCAAGHGARRHPAPERAVSFAWPPGLLLARRWLVPLAARAVLRRRPAARGGARARSASRRCWRRGSALGDRAPAAGACGCRLAALALGAGWRWRVPQLGERAGGAGAHRPGPAGGARPLALDDGDRRGAEPARGGEGRGVGDGLRLAGRPGGPHRVRRQRLSPAPAHLRPRRRFRLFLDAASPDDLGDPATDIGTALATAGKVFEHEGDRGHRAVLLVSDGESGEGDLEAATASLRAGGHSGLRAGGRHRRRAARCRPTARRRRRSSIATTSGGSRSRGWRRTSSGRWPS